MAKIKVVDNVMVIQHIEATKGRDGRWHQRQIIEETLGFDILEYEEVEPERKSNTFDLERFRTVND